jgi:hypothetical protein
MNEEGERRRKEGERRRKEGEDTDRTIHQQIKRDV